MSDSLDKGSVLCIRKKSDDEAPWLMDMGHGKLHFSPLRACIAGPGKLMTFATQEAAERFIGLGVSVHAGCTCVVCEVAFGINCIMIKELPALAKAA